MNNIKGKAYLEVIGVHTKDGYIVTGKTAISKAINDDNVLKFVDKMLGKFMASADLGPQWVALGKSEVVLLISNDYTDAISPADLYKLYLLNKKPVTPKELIEEAIKVNTNISEADIQDTRTAATILRLLGHTVEENNNPTPKYWDYKTEKREVLIEKKKS